MKTLVLALSLAVLFTLQAPTLALAESLSSADVLRVHYEVVAARAPTTADILRAPYAAAPVRSTAMADVLRAPYAHN